MPSIGAAEARGFVLDLIAPRGCPTRCNITLVCSEHEAENPQLQARTLLGSPILQLARFDLAGLTAYPPETLPSLGLLSPLTRRPCENDKSKA